MLLASPHRPQPSDGVLTCEQRLSAPARASTDIALLLDELERAHFAAVERATAGVIRCQRRDNRVACLLLGRWPALLFGEAETTIVAGGGQRQWPIVGGGLARPGGPLGVLRLSVARGEGSSRVVLSSAVTGFPSRFLGDPPPLVPRPLWHLVGRIYRAYHERVSLAALESVARASRHGGPPPVRAEDA
jgi:hypothetical protein